jgi:hypothetical protein
MYTYKIHYLKDGEHKSFTVKGDTMEEIRQKSADKKKELGIDTTKNRCWSEKEE